MRLRDFKGLFNKSTETIKKIENPYEDYFVIDLHSTNTNWRAGEHGVFTMSDKKVEGKSFRPFSVASIPEEGDKVNVRGPFGWFVLKDEITPIVLIATGVGITPIRSLLKEIEKGNQRFVNIIYSSRDFYLFKDDIMDIVNKDYKININFTSGSKETSEVIKGIAQKYKNDAYYYVSGSANVIKSIRKTLKDKDIKRKNIINDPFFGY
ncbi:FAD-dependent oxidoreductase [Senegalia sp. (in: firmicutes)]|uniref:FAD-dependent oxidoreductase n=1 Tax=Senegalia sp. (in: firmicutes) TaxID=1924098 RepID=UPI003F96C54D